MQQPPAFVDFLLALPIPLLIGVLLAYWGLLAVVIHRRLVPWLAGPDGGRLGRLEAEVPAQIGLAFGLLVSFIAMPVWEQHNVAQEAARSEAAAYREMAESLAEESGAGAEEVRSALGGVVEFLVGTEWAQMARLSTPRVAAPALRRLRGSIHALPEGSIRTELGDLYRQAAAARDTRLRIAATRQPPVRWTIVGTLAILTLVGVGLIHAGERRARRMALGMVAIGITCCFIMLFAYARPYLGQFAVQPDDLRVLAGELRDGEGPSRIGAGGAAAAVR